MIDLKPLVNLARFFSLNNSIAMLVLPHDFDALELFVPDKTLLRFFVPSGDTRHVLPISWYIAYLYIANRLGFFHITYEYSAVFNPVCTWALELDTYTFSREFLEYLLEDLIKEEQTEGALLVIKKLAEMGEENNAEKYDL